MAATKSRIAVRDLEVGMYVCELDRPWCQTPFPMQGFYINSDSDMHALKSFCQHVYIDLPLSRGEFDHLAEPGTINCLNVKQQQSRDNDEAKQVRVAPIRIKSPVLYKSKRPMQKAVRQAEKLMQKVESKVREVYEDVARGAAPNIVATEEVAAKMVANVIDNPDALLWLARVQKKDEHTYYHAVSASVWGLVLGRQMGLEVQVLETLATGLLLSQVGKAKLPKELLENVGYQTAEEYRIYQRFVTEGVELLKQDPNITPQVISVVEYHRERHNGSGFPKGVTGEKIPLLGKIAGLVDRFQELLQPRDGLNALGPAQALAVMFQGSNIEFQADLLERFVNAIGVYPTGSIVELTSLDLAVVVRPNEDRKLWPTVMLLEPSGKRKKDGKLVNLKEYNEKQKRESQYVQIAKTLPQEGVDIDVKDLVAASGGRWSLGSLF